MSDLNAQPVRTELPAETAEYRARAVPSRRILIIVENLPVPLDRRVWQEAKTLRAAGYEVSVICPKTPKYNASRDVIDGVEIYRHPLANEAHGILGYFLEYGSALFWQLVLSFRILATRGFDVIQACNPPDTIFLLGGLFKFLFGKKFVFDHHDLAPELFQQKFGSRPGLAGLSRAALHSVLLGFESATFRIADHVISNNPEFAEIAVARGGKRRRDISVVRSGPDLSTFHRVDVSRDYRQGRRHLGIYLGIMGSQDGVDLLLHAAHHIVHGMGRADIQFLLIGDGPELKAMRRLCADLALTEHVTFTGYLTGPALLEALSAGDVGICPDPKNEMNDRLTMNKVLEYMSCGLPVAMFDLAEGRRLAGDCAAYARDNAPYQLAQAIMDLVDDPERRARLGAMATERVKLFAWERESRELLRAYEALWA